MVYERANAKINLSLEVRDSDEYGYHIVRTIMIPISIYDELEFEYADEVYVENDTIENNIAIKAAKLFIEEFNINSGVCIKIKKNIPIAAGLAGGSTDAAAVLRGLNRLFNVNASLEVLEKLCSKLGSDVAFFIKNKLALCTHYGEIINTIDINYKKIPILLIKQNTGLSTALVYKNYEYIPVDRTEYENNIIEALKENDISLLSNSIFNDLNKVSLQLSDELNNIYQKLSINHKVFISGSGPTMFIINPSKEEIENIKKSLDSSFYVNEAYMM